MEPLIIQYSISKKVKYISITAGGYLLLLSLILSIQQAINKNFQFLFYVGVVGTVVAALLLLILTIWQSDVYIEVNNDDFIIKLPKQEISGVISWESVSEVGIGLSHFTFKTADDNYKIDLGNLKYNDIKMIKTKLIEICEGKSIPFGNI